MPNFGGIRARFRIGERSIDANVSDGFADNRVQPPQRTLIGCNHVYDGNLLRVHGRMAWMQRGILLHPTRVGRERSLGVLPALRTCDHCRMDNARLWQAAA